MSFEHHRAIVPVSLVLTLAGTFRLIKADTLLWLAALAELVEALQACLVRPLVPDSGSYLMIILHDLHIANRVHERSLLMSQPSQVVR